MTWNSGTATNYRDLFNQLIQVATSRHLATVAVNAGGSGYVVGDVLGLTNTGATFSHVAQVEVRTVGGGGAITSLRIWRGGAYTVDPTTTTGNALTGGTGTLATANLTFAATGWSTEMRTQQAVSAVVAAGGSGYSVGNLLTVVLDGGVQGHGGVAAVFQVATLGGGGSVATVTLSTAGNYEKVPTNPAATTGGAGTGATLTVTWGNATTQDNMLAILTGTAGGAVDPIVGIKLWQGLNSTGAITTFNWALFGMTAFDDTQAFHEQNDMSPGLAADGSIIAGNLGVFVPLKDTTAFNITWWISATGRRIMGEAKVQTASTTYYVPWHLGLLNQLGTTTEFNYPLYIAGSTNRNTGYFADTTGIISGLTECIFRVSSGGAVLWWPDGSYWSTIRNASIASDTTLTVTPGGTSNDDNGVYPMFRGGPNLATEDTITSDGGDAFNWDAILFNDSGGALSVYPTPNTGTDVDILVPAIVLRTDSSVVPQKNVKVGEIDGLYWTSAASGQSSEDDILVGTNRYRLFQNGNRIQTYSFCAMRED